MSYWRLFYHLVWATKSRAALIDDERAGVIEKSIRSTSHDAGSLVHAVGMMPDHIHVAVSIPPSIAISDFVKRLKGASSHLLNHGARRDGEDRFVWQPQYGVVSLGERSLDDVVAYVVNQRARHAANELWSLYEKTELLATNHHSRGLSPEGTS